jgi:acetylornithine deacetylase/succinyl-diaminopimelate desuccinylase-like protein
MNLPNSFTAHVDNEHGSYIADVASLCALPSVSAQNRAIDETADWVSERLRQAGFQTELLTVGGSPPTVWAETGEGERTLLFYNHYDVQPPEPLDLWESDPFVLTERGGNLYARGVADNKADLLSRIHAIEAYRATIGDLPCRVRFLVEGEEEVGSPHLGMLIGEYADRWRANGCIWEGSGRDEDDEPAIYCGVKGMLYLELSVRTLDRDLHSMLGGVVPNAAWRLMAALATMRAPDGTILIDGLTDAVRSFTPAERDAIARLRFDAKVQQESWGARHLLRGLDGQAALHELIGMPTVNIAGIESGYTGPGAKTIIPAEASAKVDIRLVPDMTATDTFKLVRDHLQRHGFDDVRVEQHSGQDPARTPVDHPLTRTAEETWNALGEDQVKIYPNMPGTGPAAVVSLGLRVPLVMAGGVSWPGDRIHSPNESIRTHDYAGAVRYWGDFIGRFAADNS